MSLRLDFASFCVPACAAGAAVAASLLSASACAPAPTTTKTPTAAPFVVDDGFIRDDEGRAVVLRGVNLSGYHKNKPYFDFHGPADFAAVRDRLGMNSIRFLIEWAAVEPSPGEYDDVYLYNVRTRLDWARDAGLLVVLDMHQDLYGEGFAGGNGAPPWTCDAARYAAYQPAADWFLGYLDDNVVACFDGLWTDPDLQDHYARAWAHVADQLGDHDAVIGFEVINEPWQGSFAFDEFEERALQPFYELVIPAVRKKAPHWLAFVEPMSMSNLGRDSHLTKMPFDNVVYAPHSYDSATERAGNFADTERPIVLDKLIKLAGEAKRMGAALWIGEYGGNAQWQGISSYMDAEYDAFASVFAGSTYWDDSRGDGFGLLNDDGSEKTVLWDVVVRPAPERIAGIPGAWSYDDATRSLTVHYTAGGDGDADSVFRAPTLAYPEGYVVDVDGGTATVTGEVVTVEAAAGADVTVTIRPAR